MTFCSRSLIPDAATHALCTAVAKLEDVPESAKDWHPGTDGQVLDLVHPSLYCVVYGTTWVRKDDGSALATPPPLSSGASERFLSQQFAWLPSDFLVESDGQVCLLSPYINNLHPSNEELYRVIPTILGKFVPLFERVLGSITTRRGRDSDSGRMRPVECIWLDGEADYNPAHRAAKKRNFAGYPGEDYSDRQRAWLLSRELMLPDAVEAYAGTLEGGFRTVALKGRTLQCIVKMANIHLSPDKPTYPGGSWHVEGKRTCLIISDGPGV